MIQNGEEGLAPNGDLESIDNPDCCQVIFMLYHIILHGSVKPVAGTSN
ncbi:hypothetical protein F441_19235 [Phytophthora nicotianae CJ01A1]|uniref:Uncharacterized protein n=2 Tax=Phytophthora nicotianae TaxID=4792 RepID=W2K7A3_PHYNI|nr:hypothetical protein L917_18553 [Phytophthora nicotianae]ETM34227.1 hypothetical protein L914_18648 [Phytophthora nicotianae]ETP03888.1 hypothetical protein F441_19235 [Phytophthora nicotianae CJ01A1]